MQNIYTTAFSQIYEGAKYSINLERKTLKVNGKYLIQDGVCDGDFGVDFDEPTLTKLESLYDRYNHSRPSERTEAKRINYFIALPEHQLDDEDMLYGESRETAQFTLEYFILTAILSGKLVWDGFAKDKWFWQSPKHPTLILLKKWF